MSSLCAAPGMAMDPHGYVPTGSGPNARPGASQEHTGHMKGVTTMGTTRQDAEEVKQPFEGCVSRWILMRHDEEGHNHAYLYGWPIVGTEGDPKSRHSIDIVQVFAETAESADYLAHYQNGRLMSGWENRGALIEIQPEDDPIGLGRTRIPQVFTQYKFARQHAWDHYSIYRPALGYDEDGNRIVSNTEGGTK